MRKKSWKLLARTCIRFDSLSCTICVDVSLGPFLSDPELQKQCNSNLDK